MINEPNTLETTNGATDTDLPIKALKSSLIRVYESGSADCRTGVLIWTPTEAQGPSTNLIAVRVTDNGSPPLSDTKTFTVVVKEVNRPPMLVLQSSALVSGPYADETNAVVNVTDQTISSSKPTGNRFY